MIAFWIRIVLPNVVKTITLDSTQAVSELLIGSTVLIESRVQNIMRRLDQAVDTKAVLLGNQFQLQKPLDTQH